MNGLRLKVTGRCQGQRHSLLRPELSTSPICLVEGKSASMTPVCAVPPDTVPRLTVEEMLSVQCHMLPAYVHRRAQKSNLESLETFLHECNRLPS
jgi:hypothetical protein